MDLILCASEKNKIPLKKMYPGIENKMYTLKEYVEYGEKDDLDIIEPWGKGIETYRMCIAEIEKCVDKLIEKLK